VVKSVGEDDGNLREREERLGLEREVKGTNEAEPASFVYKGE
jgi:hypothetical protein